MSWKANNGETLAFDNFSPGPNGCVKATQLGIARVDLTVPFAFTQIRGTIFARSLDGYKILDTDVSCRRRSVDGDLRPALHHFLFTINVLLFFFQGCDASSCPDGSPWGNPVSGILFGTESTLIKKVCRD